MKVIAILSDYFGSVSIFSSSRASFKDRVSRVFVEFENGDFTKVDVQLSEAFIESQLRSHVHIVHFDLR
jgi:hypothetical protein